MSAERFELTARKFINERSTWLLVAIEKLEKQTPGARKRSRTEIKKEYAAHKSAAMKLVKERLEYFNEFYGFKIGKITIRNQSSRWGSCSRKGNLNFNYRIALIPSHLADYIVVHELCHIGQLNHSQKFWDLVAKTIPDHKKIRKELRENFNLM